MELVSFLEKRSKPFWVWFGFLLVALLGIVDFLTGVELSITLFYLIPIFLVAWFADEGLALALSATSVLVWFITDYLNGLVYSILMIYVWNTLIRLVFFIILSRLLTELRKALKANQESARVDYGTGATSVRYFYELARIEISRHQRSKHPFSLVYLDLDNFKMINDRLGHATGDKVLRVVTECIQRQIRPGDIFARLGGDEFALFLPETGGETVKQAMSRMHSGLVNEMLKNGWVVTFSMGVVTFNQIPKSVDEMIRLADSMMYSVKTNGKNGVRYQVYGG
jgi:diguanylate cyclase (GGDEF)-like protein